MSEFKQFQEILSKDDDDEIHFCNSSMNCGDTDYNVTGVVDSFFEDEGDKPSNYCLDYAIQLDTGENLNEDDPDFIDRTGNITIGNQLFRREHPAYERMTGICIPNKAVKDINENQKEFINKNEVILKKLGRINNILNDDLEKPAATMVVSGDLFKIYFDKDVDLKLIKENLTNKQSRLEQEMNKISQRLENKSFVDRAPKEIVEQEKNNYNNLKNDIEKISVTIKGI